MSNLRKAGFTLMEVLVSLFISAMIMTAILSSLDSTQRAVDAIHNLIQTESTGPKLMALLREDLSRIAVYDMDGYEVLSGTSHTLHGADADRLDFIAHTQSRIPHYDPLLDVYVRAPLVEIGYWVRERPGSSDFLELYRREDFLLDEEPFRGGNWAMLNNRIINFSLLYAGEPAYEPSWEEEWNSMDMGGLPFLFEVSMELEIQPRKSSESRLLLGANRSRLEFQDFLRIPEPVRWSFRNRIHPTVPGEDEAEQGTTGTEPSVEQSDILRGSEASTPLKP